MQPQGSCARCNFSSFHVTSFLFSLKFQFSARHFHLFYTMHRIADLYSISMRADDHYADALPPIWLPSFIIVMIGRRVRQCRRTLYPLFELENPSVHYTERMKSNNKCAVSSIKLRRAVLNQIIKLKSFTAYVLCAISVTMHTQEQFGT